MQTFLPYPGFKKSAQVLDNKRLGKMRVESLQILNCLDNGPYQYRETIIHKWESCSKEIFDNSPKINTRKTPWYNHPAVKQWWTYENHLVDYGVAICDEWVRRGFRDTCKEKILKYQKLAPNGFKGMHVHWLGNEKFHASHRSNLLRKNCEWYGRFNWKEPDNLPYFWPTKELTS